MSVIVMEVKQVEKHPNADSLLQYKMHAPTHPELQVIANQERVYEIGDRVAIALVGSTLKDGTKISATKLRGIPSYGMALGTVDQSIGTDLSPEYCQVELRQFVPMIRWPSIELFHNLRRTLAAMEMTPCITYQAKLKLDGTNAAVQIFSDGRVAGQSRTQVITPSNDNMGFAQWLSQCQDEFSAFAQSEHLTIFGEWCGKGIQGRTAISQIDRRVFVVFAIQFGGVNGEVARLEVNPDQIAPYLPKHPDVYLLPFYGKPFTLDFKDGEGLKEAIAQLNQTVEAVERIDPWVKETFGIEGLGEGLVLYPEMENPVERLGYSELLFKAKGTKHQVVKSKAPAQLDPELVKNIDEFVAMFVTPNRLEQALSTACDDPLDLSQLGSFLKWLTLDVKKESGAELETAQLTWKDVNKAVTGAAKTWFLDQVKNS